jgi:hypothetical protein
MPARMPMIVITTSISTSVKARRARTAETGSPWCVRRTQRSANRRETGKLVGLFIQSPSGRETALLNEQMPLLGAVFRPPWPCLHHTRKRSC